MNFYKKIITLALNDFRSSHPNKAAASSQVLGAIQDHMKKDVETCLKYIDQTAQDPRTDYVLAGYLKDAYQTARWTQEWYAEVAASMKLDGVPLTNIKFKDVKEYVSFFPEEVNMQNWPYYAAVVIGLYSMGTSYSLNPFLSLISNAGLSAWTYARMSNGDKYKRIIYGKIADYERKAMFRLFGSPASSRSMIVQNLEVRENIPPKEFIAYARAEANRIGDSSSDLKKAILEGCNEAELLLTRDNILHQNDSWYSWHSKIMYCIGFALVGAGWFFGFDYWPGLQVLAVNLFVEKLLVPIYDFVVDQQDVGVEKDIQPEENRFKYLEMPDLVLREEVQPQQDQAMQSSQPDQLEQPAPVESSASKKQMQPQKTVPAPTAQPTLPTQQQMISYYRPLDQREKQNLDRVIETFYEKIMHVSANEGGKQVIRQQLVPVFEATNKNIVLLNYFASKIVGEDAGRFQHKNSKLDTLAGKELTTTQSTIIDTARDLGKKWLDAIYNNSFSKVEDRISILNQCLAMPLFNVHTGNFLNDPFRFTGSKDTATVGEIREKIKLLHGVLRNQAAAQTPTQPFTFTQIMTQQNSANAAQDQQLRQRSVTVQSPATPKDECPFIF